MDLLNKAFAQLNDLFRSMTPAGRLTAGLLLVGVVVSLGYLFQHQASGPDVYLMNGEPLTAGSLPAMEAAFAKANLTSFTVDGTRIRVPHGQQAAYMAALADAKALPPNFGSAMRAALGDDGPFASPEQRKLRFKIALQEELSRIIGQMTDIDEASVFLDSQRQPGLSQETLSTASISVKSRGTAPLDPARVPAIRGLVAAAWAGLKPENVVVVDLNSGRRFSGDPQQGGDGTENVFLATKAEYERTLKVKLLSALSYIPNLTVEPTIELNPEQSTHSQQIKVDPKTVSVRRTETSKTRTHEGGGAGSGGRPGFQAGSNSPTNLNSGGGKGPREEEEDSATGEENEPILREHIVKDTVGFTPKRATVAVGIPSSYFESVWHERNPVKEGEEPKTPDAAALDAVREEVSTQVRTHVLTLLKPLLPAEATQNVADLVTITIFQDMKSPPLPGPSIMQKVLAWLEQHWSTLGLIGLVGAGLVVLRGMVRSVPPSEPSGVSLRIAATAEAPPEPSETPESVAAKRLRRLTGGGPSLRDELSELVKEDPDAAANILRSWIGQAG